MDISLDSVPAPDGGLCPSCRVGPFLSFEFYASHWQREHVSRGASTTPPEWLRLLMPRRIGLAGLNAKRPWKRP
jgi:hypothetical protein